MTEEITIRIGANTAAAFACFPDDHPGRAVAQTVVVARVKDALLAAGYELPTQPEERTPMSGSETARCSTYGSTQRWPRPRERLRAELAEIVEWMREWASELRAGASTSTAEATATVCADRLFDLLEGTEDA